ncbi:MAG: hypothetical protein K6C96_11570 [Butyrivibrio sp.]|nr:hypothetical protein [Butyrivibrio sp.]
MTPEEIEQEKAALRQQIAHYSDIKEQLEECRNGIRETNHTIFEEVTNPVVHYDLQEGNKWRGHNYDVAVESVATINSTVNFYRSSASTVVGQIYLAIKDVEEKIEELEAALAALG